MELETLEVSIPLINSASTLKIQEHASPTIISNLLVPMKLVHNSMISKELLGLDQSNLEAAPYFWIRLMPINSQPLLVFTTLWTWEHKAKLSLEILNLIYMLRMVLPQRTFNGLKLPIQPTLKMFNGFPNYMILNLVHLVHFTMRLLKQLCSRPIPVLLLWSLIQRVSQIWFKRLQRTVNSANKSKHLLLLQFAHAKLQLVPISQLFMSQW